MNEATSNSPSRNLFVALVRLQWLVLPILAAMYAREWTQLPPRLATHFDFNNQPNGWMSRRGSLIFSLVFATIVVASSRWILMRIRKPGMAAWALMGFFYVILWTLVWATNSVVNYNTEHSPVNVAPVLIVGMGSAIVVIVLTLATRRGPELPITAAFASERHSSPLFAAVLGLPALGILAVTLKIPTVGLRVGMSLAVLLMLGATAMAWDGFHYLFSSSGVEIRTLGFRLRSIPTSQIQNYSIDQWKVAGGYGIRGVGEKRAYVWANTGVRIKLSDGEVFLGHKEPERIIHDLDVMTSRKAMNHEGHEVAPRL